jgi:hypothetical protein
MEKFRHEFRTRTNLRGRKKKVEWMIGWIINMNLDLVKVDVMPSCRPWLFNSLNHYLMFVVWWWAQLLTFFLWHHNRRWTTAARAFETKNSRNIFMQMPKNQLSVQIAHFYIKTKVVIFHDSYVAILPLSTWTIEMLRNQMLCGCF